MHIQYSLYIHVTSSAPFCASPDIFSAIQGIEEWHAFEFLPSLLELTFFPTKFHLPLNQRKIFDGKLAKI